MNEITKAIADLINTLNGGAKDAATALRDHAPQAWAIVVRQVYAEAWLSLMGWLVFACVLAGFAIALWREARRLAKSENLTERDDGTGLAIGASIVGTAAIIVALVSCASYVQVLLTPEYAAAERVLELVRGTR
jgi:hypothetical protein